MRNGLYEINAFNKNLFAFAGSLGVGNTPLNPLSTKSDIHVKMTDPQGYLNSTNIFGISKLENPLSKYNISQGIGAMAKTGIGSSILSGVSSAASGFLQNTIGGGLHSGVGNAVGDLGRGVGNLVGRVNPLLGTAINVGSGILGGGINAAIGKSVDEKALAAANETISGLNSYTNTANNFDNFGSRRAFANVGNAYKSGFLNRGWAEDRNAGLLAAVDAANSFAERSDENARRNIVRDQLAWDAANYTALGGALDIMQQDKYINAINNRTQAIAKAQTVPQMTGFAGTANRFDDGGFVDSFMQDPIQAAMQYIQSQDAAEAQQEAAAEAMAQQQAMEDMQQRLANAETQNQGLQALIDSQGLDIKTLMENQRQYTDNWRERMPDSNPTDSPVLARIRQGLIDRGINRRAHQDAILANIMVESKGNLNAKNSTSSARGLLQWLKDRHPKAWDFDSQMDYIANTYNQFGGNNWLDKKAWQRFNNTNDSIEAARLFRQYYERPEKHTYNWTDKYINQMYNRKAAGGNLYETGGPEGNILGIKVPSWAETVASFTPVLGTAMDIKNAVEDPSLANIGTAGLSLLADLSGASLVRGAFKASSYANKLKKAEKAVRKAAKTAGKTEDYSRLNKAQEDLRKLQKEVFDSDVEMYLAAPEKVLKGYPVVGDAGLNAKQHGMFDTKIKAFGGELGTNGTDFTNGLLEINVGGNHEENPHGGVQLGVDAQGVPNYVEEGETVYKDYVFSKRMNVPAFMRKQLGLGGNMKEDITFADASKKIAEASKERPNNPMDIAGLEAGLGKLAEVQEAERARMQAEEQNAMMETALAMQPANEEEEYAQEAMLEQAMPMDEAATEQQPTENMMPEEMGLMGALNCYGGKLHGLGGNMFVGGGNKGLPAGVVRDALAARANDESLMRRVLGNNGFTRFMENANAAISDPLGYFFDDEINAIGSSLARMTEPQLEKFFNTKAGKAVAKAIVWADDFNSGRVKSNAREAGARYGAARQAARYAGKIGGIITKAARKSVGNWKGRQSASTMTRGQNPTLLAAREAARKAQYVKSIKEKGYRPTNSNTSTISSDGFVKTEPYQGVGVASSTRIQKMNKDLGKQGRASKATADGYAGLEGTLDFETSRGLNGWGIPLTAMATLGGISVGTLMEDDARRNRSNVAQAANNSGRRTVKMIKTTDGQLFPTKEAAEAHQAIVNEQVKARKRAAQTAPAQQAVTTGTQEAATATRNTSAARRAAAPQTVNTATGLNPYSYDDINTFKYWNSNANDYDAGYRDFIEKQLNNDWINRVMNGQYGDMSRYKGANSVNPTVEQARILGLDRMNSDWHKAMAAAYDEYTKGINPVTGVPEVSDEDIQNIVNMAGQPGIVDRGDSKPYTVQPTNAGNTGNSGSGNTGGGSVFAGPSDWTPKPFDTWMRYAPAFGAGIMTLTDALGLTNKPDYTYANRLEAAARRAGYTPNIRPEYLGDYMNYKPLDRLYYANQLQANARATDRGLQNMSGSNRGTAEAAMLANAANTVQGLGNLDRQGEEYNRGMYERKKEYDRRTNMINNQMSLEAAMANARYAQQAQNSYISGLAQAAAMRDAIDQRVGASRSANITNFLTSLGNIGRENFAFNQINSDRSRRHAVGRNGVSYDKIARAYTAAFGGEVERFKNKKKGGRK